VTFSARAVNISPDHGYGTGTETGIWKYGNNRLGYSNIVTKAGRKI
jgi:hypothetical protein